MFFVSTCSFLAFVPSFRPFFLRAFSVLLPVLSPLFSLFLLRPFFRLFSPFFSPPCSPSLLHPFSALPFLLSPLFSLFLLRPFSALPFVLSPLFSPSLAPPFPHSALASFLIAFLGLLGLRTNGYMAFDSGKKREERAGNAARAVSSPSSMNQIFELPSLIQPQTRSRRSSRAGCTTG